jgi:hypothetical protein
MASPYRYIQRTYGLEFFPGERITIDGKPATVCRPTGDPAHLKVRMDGHKHTSEAHPTWRIERVPAAAAE